MIRKISIAVFLYLSICIQIARATREEAAPESESNLTTLAPESDHSAIILPCQPTNTCVPLFDLESMVNRSADSFERIKTAPECVHLNQCMGDCMNGACQVLETVLVEVEYIVLRTSGRTDGRLGPHGFVGRIDYNREDLRVESINMTNHKTCACSPPIQL